MVVVGCAVASSVDRGVALLGIVVCGRGCFLPAVCVGVYAHFVSVDGVEVLVVCLEFAVPGDLEGALVVGVVWLMVVSLVVVSGVVMCVAVRDVVCSAGGVARCVFI